MRRLSSPHSSNTKCMTKLSILKHKLIRAYRNPKNWEYSRFKGYPENTYNNLIIKTMKKLIENYLIKRLNVSHPKHYYFYRWLAECVKSKDNTNDVLCSIAGYINDNINTNLPFFDIFVIRDYVFVVTQRPSLWIGSCGSMHEAIEYRMNHNVHGDKVSDYKLEYIEDIISSRHYIGTVIKTLNEY